MYLFVAFMALLTWHIAEHLLDRKDKKEMLNRIMARNYQEFEYYDKKYPTDIEEVEKLRDEERGVRKTTPFKETSFEQDVPPEVEKFLDATETDWRADEVDIEKIQEALNERNPKIADDRE